MKKLLLLLVATVVFATCNSDDPDNTSTDNFNKTTMLTNLADNIIVPSLQDLDSKLDDLVLKTSSFTTTANQLNLDNLRTSWLNAYKVWQSVEMYNIGKAEEIQYAFKMNAYPVNTNDVENNISSGTYDLTHVNNFDAIGFPALDYLLYGVSVNDVSIIAKYTTDINANKYKTYLSDVVNQMKNLTETVLNDWTNTYRDIFVASTVNTATSANNKLVNDYIFYYEKGLRANKIGIPAGIYSATPLPTKIEAFYKKEVSKVLALEALDAVQDMFNGKNYTNGTAGEGYKTYLVSLNKANLATYINSKFDNARQKIQLLDGNFYNQINTDNTKMTQAFDALQAAVVLIKVEMLNAFNVNIDYIDADGD